jgi:peptidyl-prolyl cis-trans isomerase SurA
VPAHTANLKDDYLIFKTQAEAVKRNDDLDRWVSKKLNSTFVRLDEEYRGCDYTFNWKEAGQASSLSK